MAKNKNLSRVVTQSVTVVREGKRVTPTIGKSFDFTQEEADYLDSISPAATRKAVNEQSGLAADVEQEEAPKGGDKGTDETAPDGKAGATAARTPRRGRNTAEAKAAAADAEAEDGDAGNDAGDGEETDEDDDI